MEKNLEMKPEHAAFLIEVERYLGETFGDGYTVSSKEVSDLSLIRGFLQGMIAHAGYTAEKRADLPESPIKFK